MAGRTYFRVIPVGDFKHLGADMVMAVERGSKRPGAKVVLWSENEVGMDAQLFYEDPRTTTIRSKLNDYCFDINRNGFIVMNPYRPDATSQQWRIKGDAIQNGDDETRVVDASGYRGLVPGAPFEAYTDHVHAGPTQRYLFQTQCTTYRLLRMLKNAIFDIFPCKCQ